MTTLGWDSLESASRLSSWFHIAAIALALLFALSEFLAYIYGERADTLRRVAEGAIAEKRKKETDQINARHATEVEELQKKAEGAEKKITAFQKQQADRQLSTTQREALIRTLSPFRGQKVTV